MKGIDVSTFNGEINWCDVKDAGIEFVICRTGFGKNGLDETFARNVNDAHTHGLICGAYHYSCALTPQDAITEALFCKRIIEEAGVLLELPVFFDMEDADGYKARHGFSFTRRNVTNICRAFIDSIKPLDCGVYASYSWLEDWIDWQSLGVPIWSAQWSNRDDFKGFMWQFTDEMLIGGKKFDGNILYGR